MRLVTALVICLIAGVWMCGVSGCVSAEVAMRESLGVPKREQLVDRVKDARDSQDAAKKQFESALDEFLTVTGQKGQLGNLESEYGKFKSEHERCETRAKQVSDRIASVELVANKLFGEWKTELGQ